MNKYHYPSLSDSYHENHRRQIAKELGKDYLYIFDSLIPLLLKTGTPINEIYKKLTSKGFGRHAIFQVFAWLESNSLLTEVPHSIVNVTKDVAKSSKSFPNRLSTNELDFYRPQILLLSIFSSTIFDINRLHEGADNQQKLKNATIGVIGNGRAVHHLLNSLALCGVGTIFGVSDGRSGRDKTDPFKLSAKEIGDLNPFVQFVRVEGLEKMGDIRGKSGSLLSLIVYCPELFDEQVCRRINEISLRNRLPLLIYKLGRSEVQIGPLIIPFETACYTCYDLRKKAAQFRKEYSIANSHEFDEARLNFPIGLDFVVLDIIKYIIGTTPPLTQGTLVSLDLLSGIMSTHPVLKLPRCISCGNNMTRPPRKIWEEI